MLRRCQARKRHTCVVIEHVYTNQNCRGTKNTHSLATETSGFYPEKTRYSSKYALLLPQHPPSGAHRALYYCTLAQTTTGICNEPKPYGTNVCKLWKPVLSPDPGYKTRISALCQPIALFVSRNYLRLTHRAKLAEPEPEL